MNLPQRLLRIRLSPGPPWLESRTSFCRGPSHILSSRVTRMKKLHKHREIASSIMFPQEILVEKTRTGGLRRRSKASSAVDHQRSHHSFGSLALRVGRSWPSRMPSCEAATTFKVNLGTNSTTPDAYNSRIVPSHLRVRLRLQLQAPRRPLLLD